MNEFFVIVDQIIGVETIAQGRGIRVLPRLVRQYGGKNWRKLKGFTRVRLTNQTIHRAEVHWYEARGIGRKEFKIKRLLS